MIYKNIREEKLIFIFDKSRVFRPDPLEPKSSELVSRSISKIGSFRSTGRNEYGYFVIER
jgi:hypothetical protein